MATIKEVVESANALSAELNSISEIHRSFEKDLADTTKHVTAIQKICVTLFETLPKKVLELNEKVDGLPMWLESKLDGLKLQLESKLDGLELQSNGASLDSALETQRLEFEQAVATAHILAERKLATYGFNVGTYSYKPKEFSKD